MTEVRTLTTPDIFYCLESSINNPTIRNMYHDAPFLYDEGVRLPSQPTKSRHGHSLVDPLLTFNVT